MMAHKAASLTPRQQQEPKVDNLLDLGTCVPWNPAVWEQHLDRLIGNEAKLTRNEAVDHFVDLCTVVDTPEDQGIPREAVVAVGTRLASQCSELGTFRSLCEALFAETKADFEETNVSHTGWAIPCLVGTAGDHCLIPQHLAFLYEQAGRPAVSHRQVVRFVTQELHLLRYEGVEGNEVCGGGIPFAWVCKVFDRNHRKYIDPMVSVAVFGEERVRQALQACHESEVPDGFEDQADYAEGEESDTEMPDLSACKELKHK